MNIKRVYYGDLLAMASNRIQDKVYAFRDSIKRFEGSVNINEDGRLCVGNIVLDFCDAKYAFYVEA